ncbi:MAG: uracil-DNA glycosylase family protein [Saprospiraceae bacterium]|nr:uracil-DNA glycosylase family protein [Saprospiraceae bacterium]
MIDEKKLEEIRNCTICEEHLPLGPRPVFDIHPAARIAIISQAPGRIVHESGIAWDDQSGDRLRDWLGVDKDTFYNTPHFAIIPMGFCYPGKGKSGDLPPRKECAPQWHPTLWRMLPQIELKLVIGQYAQKRYLGKSRKRNLTETVRHYEEYLPEFLPLPHPSPINVRWRKKNEWFATDVVPKVTEIVQKIINR